MVSRKRGALVLCLLVAASLLAVMIPAWLIQPFRHQTTRDLEISYQLRRWSPLGVPILAGFTVFWIVRLWRVCAGALRRSLLALALVLSLLAAWFARQNHFEWMFRQPAHPEYAGARQASFLADQDRVLGVDLNGEAAAYPIRALAYHHLTQDRVGGVELVVTY